MSVHSVGPHDLGNTTNVGSDQQVATAPPSTSDKVSTFFATNVVANPQQQPTTPQLTGTAPDDHNQWLDFMVSDSPAPATQEKVDSGLSSMDDLVKMLLDNVNPTQNNPSQNVQSTSPNLPFMTYDPSEAYNAPFTTYKPPPQPSPQGTNNPSLSQNIANATPQAQAGNSPSLATSPTAAPKKLDPTSPFSPANSPLGLAATAHKNNLATSPKAKSTGTDDSLDDDITMDDDEDPNNDYSAEDSKAEESASESTESASESESTSKSLGKAPVKNPPPLSPKLDPATSAKNDVVMHKVADLSKGINGISAAIQSGVGKAGFLKKCPSTIFAVLGLAMFVAGIALCFLGGAGLPLLLAGALVFAIAVNGAEFLTKMKTIPFEVVQDPVRKLSHLSEDIDALVTNPPLHFAGPDKGKVDIVRTQELALQYHTRLLELQVEIRAKMREFETNKKVNAESKKEVLEAAKDSTTKELHTLIRELDAALLGMEHDKLVANPTLPPLRPTFLPHDSSESDDDDDDSAVHAHGPPPPPLNIQSEDDSASVSHKDDDDTDNDTISMSGSWKNPKLDAKVPPKVPIPPKSSHSSSSRSRSDSSEQSEADLMKGDPDDVEDDNTIPLNPLGDDTESDSDVKYI